MTVSELAEAMNKDIGKCKCAKMCLFWRLLNSTLNKVEITCEYMLLLTTFSFCKNVHSTGKGQITSIIWGLVSAEVIIR